MPKLEAELRNAAIGYKKRISSQFMLVDPASAKDHVRGTEFYVTRKIDGVMACAFYKSGKVTLVGSGGKDLTAAPCSKKLSASLKGAGAKSATILCELYCPVAKGRPRVGDVLAALADKKKIAKLRLAPFALYELDGEPFKADSYLDVHEKLSSIFKDEEVLPVQLRVAKSFSEVESIYSDWVDGEGAEGLVIHSSSYVVWKLKPRHTLDSVVIGYTTGDEGVRDMLFAVQNEEGQYRIIGSVGSGLTHDDRKSLAEKLKSLEIASSLVQADSRGVAFKMVKPELLVELSIGEFVSEDSNGKPKCNVIAQYGEKVGWTSLGRAPGATAFRIVFERVRDDKAPDVASVRESQITDLCPFAESKVTDAKLPKSEVLVRKVYKKESAGKLMVQKFVVWKTNKESDPRYPAFVYHYTDYSSSRKDPLKRDLRISNDKDQIMSFVEADIAANIKKGWSAV